MKYLKKYNELLDPMGQWKSDESGEWIDCSDRNPDKSGLYKVKVNDGLKEFESTATYNRGNGNYWNAKTDWVITHWMPNK